MHGVSYEYFIGFNEFLALLYRRTLCGFLFVVGATGGGEE
jgi:hypothetical protein